MAIDPTLLILTSLADGPKHGYALTKDIEHFAGKTLGPGTLYGCLARLESSGLIEPLAAEDRRHPYRITGAGTTVLQEALHSSAEVVRVGLARLARLPGRLGELSS
ncbi:MAG: PadR family transcriptional regulator [Actinomycetota bacterium]|nr:PadR family transcriptional regulator [Actinomycetota bacterium]